MIKQWMELPREKMEWSTSDSGILEVGIASF